jgi:hypothetical protein
LLLLSGTCAAATSAIPTTAAIVAAMQTGCLMIRMGVSFTG